MAWLVRVSVVKFIVFALGRHGHDTRAVAEAELVVTVVVDHVVLFVALELVPLVGCELRLSVPPVPGAAGGDVGAAGRHGAHGGWICEVVGRADGAAVHAVESLVLQYEGHV